MLKAKVSLRLACPKHRRFTPEHGPGAIRGGCIFCTRLLALYSQARELDRGGRMYSADALEYTEAHEL